MQHLEYSHNLWLVAASLCVALMAGFTGLSLTNGLSARPVAQKKVAVALGAVSLGGGVWSMHFVAMLGLQLPIAYYYDAAITLGSALIAILMTGIALLILHFMVRTPATIILSGTIVGTGILAMHYIGMEGLQLCRAVYTPAGVALAVIASCLLNIIAFWMAYGKRSHRNIALGTVCFGCSVFVVHFIAIFGTNFVPDDLSNELGPLIGNEFLAIGVVLSSFVICGAFLLAGVTFWTPVPANGGGKPDLAPETAEGALAAQAPQQQHLEQIPYEHEGRTMFVDISEVAAVRAEGHYTTLFTDAGKLFCSWSLTEVDRRFSPRPLIRTHRSYMVHPAHVSGFERFKDNGVCHLDVTELPKVPVSRSRLKLVRSALGI